jgi:hypothetical protein
MGTKLTEHDLVASLKKLADELGRTPTLREFSQVESKRQIDKYGHNNLVKMAGLIPNATHPDLPDLESIARPARLLFLDIEKSGILARVWGTFKQNVALNQIVCDWHLMSWAAAFDREETIHYLDQRYAQDQTDTRQLVEGIHHLISQADIIIAHNLDFDWGHLNALFIKYDLAPLHPTMVCTLKMARKLFKRGITSKKLEFLARWLGVIEKEKHAKFIGQELWNQCIAGNMEAWEEMEIYNKGDILTLREVFFRLAKYDPAINFSVYEHKNVCICGNQHFIKDGIRVTKSGKKQRFRCTSCAKVFQSKVDELSTRIKQGLFQ